MSKWTHITGAIHIDTFRELNKPELQEHIEGVLAKAPQITGSEGNAEFFVNVLGGYNTYIFDPDLNEDTGYQTDVVITINGDLRDREVVETLAETKAFLHYLKQNFTILNDAIAIENDGGYKTIV